MKPLVHRTTSTRRSDVPLRAFQWDLARQVERLDVLLDLLPRYAEWGYQELYLHLEDAVEFPSLPGVARRDAYSYRALGRLVKTATACGIGVVPIVNLLGHTQYLIKVPELRDLNELRNADGTPQERGQLCPLHPRTLEVAQKLLTDVAPFCTAGKVHVGLDESFHLGKCPRCQAEVAQIGLAAHFAGQVTRLHQITTGMGLRMGIWADMLNFIPEAIGSLPRGLIAYDWYYYSFRRHPRVELYNFGESDLATLLLSQGIEYWGCPMNGAFRFEPLPVFGDRLANIRSWWKRCQRVGASGFLVTSWEAYRLAFELTTVVDAAAACLWLNPEIQDDLGMLTRGFERVFGRSNAHSAAQRALACDRYPFAGYARWEVNERWDGAKLSLWGAHAEDAFFRRIPIRGLPAPLRSSVAFRRYLAARDRFVAEAESCVATLRRIDQAAQPKKLVRCLTAAQAKAQKFASEISEGTLAVRAMWARTRDARRAGQNEAILKADRRRLHAWQKWLSTCERKHSHAWQASPVFGAYQLSLTVRNFAPAAQKVVIEWHAPDGNWRELASRYTIEFQAIAAGRRCDIRRSFSMPIPEALLPRSSDGQHTLPTLRIAVRGVGQVRIEKVELTDGVTVIGGYLATAEVGVPALLSGFPDIAARSKESPICWRQPKPEMRGS